MKVRMLHCESKWEILTRSLSRILQDQNFIFALALILGLVFGRGAVWLEPVLLPVLALAMTLSTTGITNRDLTSIKNSARPLFTSFLLNYVVMGGLTLGMAKLMINDNEIWAGYVTLVAMPPAIAVMPFSYILRGNMVFSLIGTIGLYLVALGLAPGIMIMLLGADSLNPAKLLLILVELIIIPLVISRLIVFTGWDKSVTRWQDTAVKWCFFVIIYIIVGLNRQVFFEQPNILLKVILIAGIVTFVLGHAIYYIARKLRVDHATSISWIAMGTKKNSGLATGIVLALIGKRAAFPMGIHAIFEVLGMLWWGFYFRKWLK
jgi:BASS family bile acid:Na+ symporter